MRILFLLSLLFVSSAFPETVTVTRMTKWTWGGCNNPTAATSFSTSDPEANLYWEATDVSGSDAFSYEWDRPNGTSYSTGAWQSGSGNRCYGSWIVIAGQEPATTPGVWRVRVFKNSISLFQLDFVITLRPGVPTTTAPRIDRVEPTVVAPGVDTTFTITGAGFKSGFSGRLRVNNDPNQWPIWPGTQTTWLSDSQVKMIVKVGSSGDPSTNFSLQIINPSPGNGPSNEFGGLQTTTSATPPPSTGGSRWVYDSEEFYPSVILEKSSLGGNKFTYRMTVMGRSTVLDPGVWKCALTMVYPNGVRSDRNGIQIATTASDRASMINGTAGWSILPRTTETVKGAARAKLLTDLLGLIDPIALIQIGNDLTDWIAAGDYGPSPWFTNKLEQVDDYHIVPITYAAQKNFFTGGTGVMGLQITLPDIDESSGNVPEFYVLVQTPGFDVFSFEIGTDRNALVSRR